MDIVMSLTGISRCEETEGDGSICTELTLHPVGTPTPPLWSTPLSPKSGGMPPQKHNQVLDCRTEN